MFNLKIFIDSFTYVRLTPKDTGLNCDIWLDSLGSKRRYNKRPYILIPHKIGWKKVYIHKISKRISNEIHLWCEINKDVIECHWNNELSDAKTLTILVTKMYNKKV